MNQVKEKIKGFVDESASALKKGVDKLGDDFIAIQNYLNTYQWKELPAKKEKEEIVTISNVELNNYPKAVVVRPNTTVEGSFEYHFDRAKCHSLGLYRLLIGLTGQGAQVTIGHQLGLIAGGSKETFKLQAPNIPGIYPIRFRVVDAFFKKQALEAWKDEQGNEPNADKTIGILIVK